MLSTSYSVTDMLRDVHHARQLRRLRQHMSRLRFNARVADPYELPF